MLREGVIRPIAVAAIKRPDGRYLVHIWKDSKEKRTYFRMLGGGIEFGETAEQALARELEEEIGAKIKVGRRLDVFETRFEWQGKKCHEIVFFFEAELADKSLYTMEKIPSKEGLGADEYITWIRPDKLAHYGEARGTPVFKD